MKRRIERMNVFSYLQDSYNRYMETMKLLQIKGLRMPAETAQ
jgi:hypothetical protein